ncbi:hypothetical protein [Variovorax sp. YR216]|uniref:hypothetical protein n=1 Tax=Variovorax sp. YR216 TaxID=1882828 RepID=UPI00089C2ADA|nr:hypothetical protein [Variovorax sp. YR216]SEB20155.1 hypothetical protein SAMN05444680_11374 [Variovorax sp. YR216]
MPGFVLDQTSMVTCMHGGQAKATVPFPRVKLNKQAVVTQAAAHMVSACVFNVSGAPSPCVNVMWTTVATRVRAGGAAVLLVDSQAQCVPNGTGVLVAPSQIRVRGT